MVVAGVDSILSRGWCLPRIRGPKREQERCSLPGLQPPLCLSLSSLS